VSLSNPQDPLTLTSQVDSLTINGRTFTNTFNAAARTITSLSAVGRQTVTLLDWTGRVIEERVTGVAPVKYTYGPRGFLTTVRQAGRLLTYDYDSTGRVKKVTDPIGRIEQFLYDSVGRVVTQTLPDGRQILYSYDANGNLTSLTPTLVSRQKPVPLYTHITGGYRAAWPWSGIALNRDHRALVSQRAASVCVLVQREMEYRVG
jgi:YD repeat-containing protein